MRLLVTGAGGMLGTDVVAVARERGHECVGLTRGELDVTDDAVAVEAAVARVAPQAIVNCAAWTDVEGAELHEEARARGQRDRRRQPRPRGRAPPAPSSCRSRPTTSSTAPPTRPYVESDPTNALSAYGRTKLAGEQQIAGGLTRARRRPHGLAVRPRAAATSSRRCCGSRAGAGDELAIVVDEVGCPTYTRHLAPRLIEFAERRTPGVIHLAGCRALLAQRVRAGDLRAGRSGS